LLSSACCPLCLISSACPPLIASLIADLCLLAVLCSTSSACSLHSFA
jgi:hypothetical protein